MASASVEKLIWASAMGLLNAIIAAARSSVQSRGRIGILRKARSANIFRRSLHCYEVFTRISVTRNTINRRSTTKQAAGPIG